MQVPAVVRARSLLVGSISDLPLVAYRGSEVLKGPSWTYRSSGPLSPWHRMAATVDDLIFYGVSLWARHNGADGFPIDMLRVPRHRWDVDRFGQVLVDGRPAPADEVVIIPGPGEGLLQTAQNTITGARNIDRAWSARVRTPIPPTLFEQTEKETATQEEIQTLLNTWAAQRRNPESAAVAFVPHGLKATFPAADSMGVQDLFVEGRNAIRLDVANLLNIPGSLLDGSTATASLTYVTQDGQRTSFHEQSLRYWTAPIEHRLSMDDIMPKGQFVRFDITYAHTQAPGTEGALD